MKISLSDGDPTDWVQEKKLVMIDSASKNLGVWLQLIPMVHPSAFYKWIKAKLNVFNDAYILLLKQVG